MRRGLDGLADRYRPGRPQTVRRLRRTEIFVGLRLRPPARAVVLCVDEKSQIQALERTQPVRRVWPDRPEQRTHDYIRHGTTTLFAALEVVTGRVTNQCASHHRHQEFMAFLKQVAAPTRVVACT